MRSAQRPSAPPAGVYVLADAHRHLEDAVFLRKLKELAHAAGHARTIVLALSA